MAQHSSPGVGPGSAVVLPDSVLVRPRVEQVVRRFVGERKDAVARHASPGVGPGSIARATPGETND